jgi:hypothetical protein
MSKLLFKNRNIYIKYKYFFNLVHIISEFDLEPVDSDSSEKL